MQAYRPDADETIRVTLLPATLRSSYALAFYDAVAADVVIRADAEAPAAYIAGGSALEVRGLHRRPMAPDSPPNCGRLRPACPPNCGRLRADCGAMRPDCAPIAIDCALTARRLRSIAP